MDELTFRVWLFSFLFLTAIGPLVIWRSRLLMEKIAARSPAWLPPDTSGAFTFPRQQMNGWLKIMGGRYAELDQDLRSSCKALRIGSAVYLVCLSIALAGQIYIIVSGWMVTH